MAAEPFREGLFPLTDPRGDVGGEFLSRVDPRRELFGLTGVRYLLLEVPCMSRISRTASKPSPSVLLAWLLSVATDTGFSCASFIKIPFKNYACSGTL